MKEPKKLLWKRAGNDTYLELGILKDIDIHKVVSLSDKRRTLYEKTFGLEVLAGVHRTVAEAKIAAVGQVGKILGSAMFGLAVLQAYQLTKQGSGRARKKNK